MNPSDQYSQMRGGLPISPSLDLRARNFDPSTSPGYIGSPSGALNPGAPTPLNGIKPLERQIPIMGNITALAVNVTDQDQIVLQKPTTARIFLVLLNTDAAETVYVSWDVPASATAGSGSWPFTPGNPGYAFNFMTFVPQNELHIIAANPATFLIWYANADFPIVY